MLYFGQDCISDSFKFRLFKSNQSGGVKLMLPTKRSLVTAVISTVIFYSSGIAAGDISDLSSKEEGVITAHDTERLKSLGIQLHLPTSSNLVITKEQAISLAHTSAPKFASEAPEVIIEYQLLTYPYLTAFSEQALNKNANLRADGYLNNTPVYIVTFKGIHGTGHAARGQKVPTYKEFNVVIDASSGETLFSFTYK